MSDGISTSFSSKIVADSSIPTRTKSAAAREMELRGVIRVLINKNQRLQKPVMAAKKLATYYQAEKDEVERLKQVCHNYKTGMERAERRSAQLQQDLARASRRGADGKEEKEARSVGFKDTPKGLPFYLPSSVKQIIDALTSENVKLMKSIQRMSKSGGNVDEIVKENLEMERKIKKLQEELDLKSSLLEDYEAEMSKVEPKGDADKLARNIILQRKECTELKAKINSYQVYVKCLQERNSVILDEIMLKLDRSNQQPTESADEDDAGAVARSASAPASHAPSRTNSRNTSRRDSVKSECEFHSTGIQTDSGFCTSSERSSVDDVEMDTSPNEHAAYQQENMELRDKVARLTDLLREKEEEDKRTKQRWSDMEQTWMQMETELEKRREQSLQDEKKVKALEAAKEESEVILKMMQERVDHVNSRSAESAHLEEKIRELEEKVKELPMMQRELKNYEEEIKAYGVERKQLVEKIQQLEYEDKRLRYFLVAERRAEQQGSGPVSPDRQPGQFQQGMTQQRQRFQPDRFHQDPPRVSEPYQDVPWHAAHSAGIVVADGGHRRSNSTREDQIHERQRNRQLQHGYQREGSRTDVVDDDDDEFSAYANTGTVKCENCKERYPTGLFQDHFRDCSRDNSR